MLVADHILSLSTQTGGRRIDTAITVLLLLPSGPKSPNWTLAYQGLREGRYRIDSKLVTMLLDTARDNETQRSIAASPAFAHLPHQLYRRLFFRLWRRNRSSAWRWTLGRSLHLHLQNNPSEGRFFADAIWKIASNRREEVALAGLSNTGFLGRALTLKQAKRLIALSGLGSNKAESALNGLGRLYGDLKSLRPEVRALLLDPQTIATLRASKGGDEDSPWSGRSFCIGAIRRALRKRR